MQQRLGSVLPSALKLQAPADLLCGVWPSKTATGVVSVAYCCLTPTAEQHNKSSVQWYLELSGLLSAVPK